MVKNLHFNDLTELIKQNKLFYIYFGASWCGGCNMQLPIIEELEKTFINQVYKVDIDKEQDLVDKFGITSIPTIVLLKNNKIISKEIGFRPIKYLLERGNENEIL